jgi:hypothetical protein
MARALVVTRILWVTAGIVCTSGDTLALGSDEFAPSSANHPLGFVNRGQWNTWGIGRGSKGDRRPAPSTKPINDGPSLTR